MTSIAVGFSIGIAMDTLLAVVEGGVVATAGYLLVKGVYVKVKEGEKVKDVEATLDIRKHFKKCCCDKITPSGLPCIHVIMKATRKEAKEAALHYKNADGVMFHPHNTTDKFPHYHPTRRGKKIPGVHFQFPKV